MLLRLGDEAQVPLLLCCFSQSHGWTDDVHPYLFFISKPHQIRDGVLEGVFGVLLTNVFLLSFLPEGLSAH